VGHGFTGCFKPFLAISALGLLTVAASSPAQAITSIQTFTTTDTFSSFSPASATQATYWSPVASFTVQPFNAALGTFTSATVVWSTTAAFTGTVGTESGTGNASFSFSGTYDVDGAPYFGNGSGNGNVGNPGDTFSTSVASFGSSRLFLASDAGVNYDPNILADFIGANAYPIAYSNAANPSSSPNGFYYTNISSGSAVFTTTATVTYDYVAAPSVAAAPGPLPLLGAGAAWAWSRRLRRRCGKASR
jgi:hypothetical protein